MKKIVNLRNFQILALGISLGTAIGIGLFTFVYAKGAAYLTNNPAACANCHVMKEQYDGWIKSSHRSVATCNDCHTPPGLIAKYMNKASNGFWHSYAFTTGNFHEPIQIKAHNYEITETSCRKCHQDIVNAIDVSHVKTEQLHCISCHNSVGHLH